MTYKNCILIIMFCSIIATACQPDPEMISLGVDEEYAIERMKILRLHPEYPGERYE